MELITIPNGCYRFRGFVYQQAHFSADNRSDEQPYRLTLVPARHINVGQQGANFQEKKMRRLCLCLMFLSATLGAQNDRGMITGSVTDLNGSFIPGVAITATHLDTNTQYKAVATESGEFV